MPSFKTYLTNKNIFLFGLFLIIIGMPLSNFLMSVGQFVLLGNWIIEGDFKRKWNVIKTSKILWAMSSFYLLHLIGLLWTSDFDYAANDLKIKLPLLWFPLLFITSKYEVSKKEIQGLLWLFTSSVFIASIVCTLVWLGYTKHKVVDIRDISIFNSHIRFALMIDLVVCFLVYEITKTSNPKSKVISAFLVTWFLVFLNILQAFTGISILCIVLFYLLFVLIRKQENKRIKFVAMSLLIVFFAGGALYIIVLFKSINPHYKPEPVLLLTRSGNPYISDTTRKESENGNLIWINVCTYELQKEWDKRSEVKFHEKDKKGNDISTTIVRYLSSKGLSKDSVGISQLNLSDILWIQKGKSNYKYTNRSGFETRLHSLLNEYNLYKRGENPAGHTVLMRLEFWRVGMEIIKRKWLVGVGTGDVQSSFSNQYQLSNSKLNKEWYKRSHNQFMAATIAFGIIGLVVFFIYLFYPVIAVKQKHYLFNTFLLISMLSMINEDTLETQAGVTFFGFFYSIFLNERIDFRKLKTIEIQKK